MFSLKKTLKVTLFMGLAGFLALIAIYFYIRSELPSVTSLKSVQWQTPMKIYSADGKLMNQFGEKKRIPLLLEDMPKQLIDAVLATEDDRFYMHFGVDPIGMTRAVIGQIMGKNKGGASTITMQVARNFFLTREQTYIRKLREIFTAFHIEYLLSKDEILALYMNKIPLGHRSFGFGAAAQVYYNKNVNELTLAQIAVLAGLPKAPSSINPISNPERALARRSIVLQRMLVTGYITQQEYQTARNAPITARKYGAEIELSAPYAAEMAHLEMVDRFGKEQAYTGGYKVFTTVTEKLQNAAKQSVIENLLAYDRRHGYRGPILQLRKQDPLELADSKTLDPILAKEIEQTLSTIPNYQPLVAAVVTSIYETSIEVTFENQTSAIIEWSGLSWAREFFNDDKQGDAPQSADQIASYGDVVYVLKKGDIYTLSQFPSASSALVSLSPDNGAIQAVVGGFSFRQSQFNRVTQAKRQVGSNIKPFVYSAALDNNFTLASLVNDVPINQWDQSTGVVWRPKNSPEQYSGEIRVKRALAQSKNVVAVRLFRDVGLDRMIPHLASFGFAPDELPKDESLALGSASLTPLEVATGFAVFANGGFLVEPFIIDRIEDAFGNIIFQANPRIACDDCSQFEQGDNLTADLNPPTSQDINTSDLLAQEISKELPLKKAERVISSQNAFLITQALNEAIWGADWSVTPGWQGTGFRGRTLNRRDIAGKTGTTNEAKDAWFSGYNRRIVTTSWIGFDNPSRSLGSTTRNKNLDKTQITGKEFGAKSAQPAWISFMNIALADLPVEPFVQPEDIITVRIDKATGKLTKRTDKSSTFEYFTLGTAPTEYVTQDNSHEIFDNEKTSENEIF